MILQVTEFGQSVGKTSERVVIRQDGRAVREVPMLDIDAILISSKGVSLSTDLIAECASRSIPISFTAWSGDPYAIMMTPSALSDAKLRRLQLEAYSNGRGCALAHRIITGKLKNQASILKYFAKSRGRSSMALRIALMSQAEDVVAEIPNCEPHPSETMDQCRGRLLAAEGRAAAAYWLGVRNLLPDDLEFTKRERRGATDPFNSMLNYGYGILYNRVWGVLIRVGLDPYAGFIHSHEDNKPSMVFDFIEEFRQLIVDRPLISAARSLSPRMEDGRLDERTRKAVAAEVINRIEEYEVCEGRHLRISDIMMDKAYEVARFIRGESDHVAFVCSW